MNVEDQKVALQALLNREIVTALLAEWNAMTEAVKADVESLAALGRAQQADFDATDNDFAPVRDAQIGALARMSETGAGVERAARKLVRRLKQAFPSSPARKYEHALMARLEVRERQERLHGDFLARSFGEGLDDAAASLEQLRADLEVTSLEFDVAVKEMQAYVDGLYAMLRDLDSLYAMILPALDDPDALNPPFDDDKQLAVLAALDETIASDPEAKRLAERLLSRPH